MHKIFPLFFFFFLIQFLSLFRRKVLIENLFNQEAESPANQCRKDNTEPWEIHQQYPSCAEENKYRNRSCRVSDHHQKGYPQGIPCNKQTAEAWGMREGELFRCEPYLQISTVDGSHAMWVPSIRDCLADDWMIADVPEE